MLAAGLAPEDREAFDAELYAPQGTTPASDQRALLAALMGAPDPGPGEVTPALT